MSKLHTNKRIIESFVQLRYPHNGWFEFADFAKFADFSGLMGGLDLLDLGRKA